MVEGANHPVAPAADEILNDRGVVVLPDILANAVGVIVGSFEWVLNSQDIRWDSRTSTVASTTASRAYQQCCRFQNDRAGEAGAWGARQLSLREAAFSLAVERAAHAAAHRGYL